MANLTQARRRLIATMIGFGVLDLIAGVVLLSPLVQSSRSRQEKMDQLQEEVQKKIDVVIRPDQVQSHIDEARRQIEQFDKERVPTASSTINAQLYKLASENKVTFTQARYDEKDAGVPGFRVVVIDATMVGNYLQEVKFINALERDHLLFLLDSITLGEQQGGQVRLQLKLRTYLKGQA